MMTEKSSTGVFSVKLLLLVLVLIVSLFSRYVFIFDKVLMICKASRGNLYSYKNALVLSDYQVEDSDSNNNKSVIKVSSIVLDAPLKVA